MPWPATCHYFAVESGRQRPDPDRVVDVYREEQRLLNVFPTKMSVAVDHDHLRIDLSGFLAPMSRSFPREEIERVELRENIVMRPFGTWGLLAGIGAKVAPGLGRVYNFGHDRGVGVTLRDGDQVVVGSSRPEELLESLGSGRD